VHRKSGDLSPPHQLMSVTLPPAGSFRPALAYVARGLPHYRLPFIRALQRHGIRCYVFAAGHLGGGFIEGRDEEVQLIRLRRPIPSWRGDIVKAIRRVYPDYILLEHGASLDFTWSLLATTQMREVPRILWTHGIERVELYSGRRSVASVGRWWQLARADALLCYDYAMASRLRQQFPDKHVGVAPNSTDGDPLVAARRRLEQVGRLAVRRRHSLELPYYIVGLGRLVRDKEFHRLIRILSLIRSRGLNAGLIFVGTGPELPRIRKLASVAGFAEGREIEFVGAVSDPASLAEWLYCADVCVNPGYLGLSVGDCLFSGLPVVASVPGPGGPYHSPEWQYLTPGSTGWLAADNTDEHVATVTVDYLTRPNEERRRHEEECIMYAESKLGIQPMAKGLLDLLDVLAKPSPARCSGA